MIGAAETAASELGKGIPERIIVESKNGMIIGTGAGDKAFLIVMTQNGSNIDNIIKETAKASEKIEQVLSN
jgi:predicted regulator of Ras-like GTPase activity (Roadblock/LC7/MglB family)